MTVCSSSSPLVRPFWLRLVLLAAASAALAGCAIAPGAGAGAGAAETPLPAAEATPRGDIPTESDESPARKRARTRLALATGYFTQDQATIALDEVKQAIAADPDFADAHSLRGLIYMRLNDPRLAEDSLRRALALKPRDGGILHNLGWLLCQQRRYDESIRSFDQALANPAYGERSKTLMARGLCEERAGRVEQAERSLGQSYELDAGNPITAYNLARLLYERGEYPRAQFYIRRLNNSELANAESLWLGIRVERRMNNDKAVQELAAQLRRRFPQSNELRSFEQGDFQQ